MRSPGKDTLYIQVNAFLAWHVTAAATLVVFIFKNNLCLISEIPKEEEDEAEEPEFSTQELARLDWTRV